MSSILDTTWFKLMFYSILENWHPIFCILLALWFKKCHTILPNPVCCVYQLAANCLPCGAELWLTGRFIMIEFTRKSNKIAKKKKQGVRSSTIAAVSYRIVTAPHSMRPFLCGKRSAGGIGIHSGGTLKSNKATNNTSLKRKPTDMMFLFGSYERNTAFHFLLHTSHFRA